MSMVQPPSHFYSEAKRHILNKGYGGEISWYENRELSAVTEEHILRESAWVILCAGFREAVVRRVFGYLSLCFFDWKSAEDIVMNADSCKELAFLRFRNERKLNAMIGVAKMMSTCSFEKFRSSLISDPIGTLSSLPHIGKVTSFHLAKNLGLRVAKPDRHLIRLASRFGYCDVQAFCRAISKTSGDPIHVVDSVLWRFCAIGQAAEIME